ncbi:SIR2 family protein [Algoriphagus persicinus]|uniref:SIR2 family protein n=1 Tax=Algoriphagus persicinus TaxID=3108754 RepID=UPI002B37E065|nr:SIR2 family protein [Algoriphagus sp. E1-3-M2]MEB2786400.1 SIR2 family protein [Algoriphagus sp. E1-3-M2]
MESKNRKVFLLSAGAALDWYNGPTTEKITQKILNVGLKNKKGEWITKCIFDKLNKGGEPDYRKVNFETIVNVIEDFISFWSKNESNILSFFILEKDIKWDDYIGEYAIINLKKNYDLVIKGESEAILSRMTFIPISKNPKIVYFETLLMKIFDTIISIIDDYSNTYKSNSGILSSKNDKINKAFNEFIKFNAKNILRIYSTNYDKVVETLFDKGNIEFTDGFENLPKGIPKHIRHLIPHAIYLNNNLNCIYHLHGSAYWKVIDKDENGLDYYNFVSSAYMEIAFNNGIPSFAIEKGSSIPIFNIITGYRKVSRTGLSPFRQFFSAFDRDCYNADELIIIGYSFGDEHINDIINKSRYSNKELKIEIVDPAFIFGGPFNLNISKWGFINYNLDHEIIDEKITYYRQIGLTVYKMNFIEYLQIKSR